MGEKEEGTIATMTTHWQLTQSFQVGLEVYEVNYEGKLNTYIANQPPHNLLPLPPLPPLLPLLHSHHLRCLQRQTLQYNSCEGGRARRECGSRPKCA